MFYCYSCLTLVHYIFVIGDIRLRIAGSMIEIVGDAYLRRYFKGQDLSSLFMCNRTAVIQFINERQCSMKLKRDFNSGATSQQ